MKFCNVTCRYVIYSYSIQNSLEIVQDSQNVRTQEPPPPSPPLTTFNKSIHPRWNLLDNILYFKQTQIKYGRKETYWSLHLGMYTSLCCKLQREYHPHFQPAPKIHLWHQHLWEVRCNHLHQGKLFLSIQ